MFRKRQEAQAKERIRKLEGQIAQLEAERDTLTDRNLKLRERESNLERQLKHQDDDLKHMVKLKESQLDQEYRRKELVALREKDEAIAEVKDQYRDKLESQLRDEMVRIREMYGEVLARLPNVNVRMKGEVR